MAKSRCESTHLMDSTPCATAASFVVRVGTRRTDEQWCCRRHLARVVAAFSGAEDEYGRRAVTVTWVP